MPAPGRSARCRRRPALRGVRRLASRLGMPAGGRRPGPLARHAPVPRSRRALPPAGRAPTTRARPGPAIAAGAEDEGEGGCPAPPSLPPDSLPSAAARSASRSVSPASSPPLRRARPLSGLPAVSLAEGRREPPPPPPARSSASSRVPPASPHPCEWPGGSQLAAGPPPPLPRRNQWAPAAGKPRPPPGGGGLSRRRAGLRKGRIAEGGLCGPAPCPPRAVWTCHVGEEGAAAVCTPGQGRSVTASPRAPSSATLCLQSHFHNPRLKGRNFKIISPILELHIRDDHYILLTPSKLAHLWQRCYLTEH